MCVLTECVTQRSSGLVVTKVCQVAPILNVANVQGVPVGSQQEVGQGALPALPCLGANWHTLVTRDMKCTSQLATQNTLCQMDNLCHQQHEKPSGQIGLRGVIKINGVLINK